LHLLTRLARHPRVGLRGARACEQGDRPFAVVTTEFAGQSVFGAGHGKGSGLSNEGGTQVTKWLLAAAVAALAFAPGQLQATPLSPGGSVTPDGLASLPSGTLIGSVQSASFASVVTPKHPQYTGTIYYATYRESSGAIDFLYQIQVNTDSGGKHQVNDVNTSDFGTFTTNVSYLNSTSVPQGFQAPTSKNGTTPSLIATNATRTGTGSNVDFELKNVGAGQVSAVFFIRTNATAFGSGTTVMRDSNRSNPVRTYQPIPSPEPGTLVLAAGCLVGFGVFRRWKRPTAS
jgi:hypothetical protein